MLLIESIKKLQEHLHEQDKELFYYNRSTFAWHESEGYKQGWIWQHPSKIISLNFISPVLLSMALMNIIKYLCSGLKKLIQVH